MKLLQRIVLNYYRIKFKLLEKMSLAKAAKEAFELFCTPYTKRRKYVVPEIFTDATQLSFKFDELVINGFRWKPEKPNGCKVLICHGFDSNSYKFEKFIQPLSAQGFEVLAFDAPGHGTSTGKTITALLYKNMLLKVNAEYGPVDAVIAHSFGGIAAALTLENPSMHLLKRLVLVAPATETTRSLNDFCRFLRITPRLKEEMERMIVRIEGHGSSWYSVARIIQITTVPTLWLHDKKDTVTPFEDMEHLTKLHLPAVKFIITEGLGHSLYREENIAEQIIAFVSTLKE